MTTETIEASVGFGDYFSTINYAEDEQTVSNAWKINTIVSRLSEAVFLSACVAGGSFILSLGYFAVSLMPVGKFLLITSIAISAIGFYLSNLVSCHLLTFPEKKRAQFALERLKEHLKSWPSFVNHEAFQVHLLNHPDFGFEEILNKVRDINKLYPLVEIFYDPIKTPYPQIRVNTSALDEEEIKQVLLDCFREGVIVHLTNLEIHRPGGLNDPVEAFIEECKNNEMNQEAYKFFNKSQEYSCFLFDEIKKQCLRSNVEFPQDHILKQLQVLTPKLYIGMHGYPFRPSVIVNGGEISKIPLEKYFFDSSVATIFNPAVTVASPLSYLRGLHHWIKG